MSFGFSFSSLCSLSVNAQLKIFPCFQLYHYKDGNISVFPAFEDNFNFTLPETTTNTTTLHEHVSLPFCFKWKSKVPHFFESIIIIKHWKFIFSGFRVSPVISSFLSSCRRHCSYSSSDSVVWSVFVVDFSQRSVLSFMTMSMETLFGFNKFWTNHWILGVFLREKSDEARRSSSGDGNITTSLQFRAGRGKNFVGWW